MTYVKGEEGRGVRVVGWLKEEQQIGDDNKPQSKIIIVAEHVEFSPEQEVNYAT
jgi:single-strand DNA-binding protein